MPDWIIYIYGEEDFDKVAELIGSTLRNHFRRYRVEAVDGEKRVVLDERPTLDCYA